MAAAPKIREMQKALSEAFVPQRVTDAQPPPSQCVLSSGGLLLGGTLVPIASTPMGITTTTATTVMFAPSVRIEDDYHGWLLDQTSILRGQRYMSLDWSNLTEELEAMARRDRTEVISHLRNLLANFLKWAYSAKRRSDKSWKGSIVRARLDLSLMVDDSATLRNQLPVFLLVAYNQARTLAADEMQLDKHEAQNLFPHECPWSIEQLRDNDFLPEIASTANGR
jgi:uncharacterized protein DUF29